MANKRDTTVIWIDQLDSSIETATINTVMPKQIKKEDVRRSVLLDHLHLSAVMYSTLLNLM